MSSTIFRMYFTDNASSTTNCTYTHGWGNWYSIAVSTPLQAVQLPVNWRWFHIFRPTLLEPVVRVLNAIHESYRRTQERYPMQQRARWKRRRFIHENLR